RRSSSPSISPRSTPPSWDQARRRPARSRSALPRSRGVPSATRSLNSLAPSRSAAPRRSRSTVKGPDPYPALPGAEPLAGRFILLRNLRTLHCLLQGRRALPLGSPALCCPGRSIDRAICQSGVRMRSLLCALAVAICVLTGGATGRAALDPAASVRGSEVELLVYEHRDCVYCQLF